MRIACLIAGFLLLTSLCCSAEPIKDGFYDEKDSAGHVVRTVEYQLGEPNGHFRTYYPDGRINGTGTYRMGQLDGEALGFWPDGTLKIKSFYEDGKLHGRSTLYYKTGKPQAEI